MMKTRTNKQNDRIFLIIISVTKWGKTVINA